MALFLRGLFVCNACPCTEDAVGLSQAPRRNGEGPEGVNMPLPVKGVTVPEKAVTGRPDAAAAATCALEPDNLRDVRASALPSSEGTARSCCQTTTAHSFHPRGSCHGMCKYSSFLACTDWSEHISPCPSPSQFTAGIPSHLVYNHICFLAGQKITPV